MIVEIEPQQVVRIEEFLRRAEGHVPVSAESVVNMAVEAFLDGSLGEDGTA